MYLHLGQNTAVLSRDIVGIFDMDTSTVAKNTREYLKKAEQNGQVVTVSYELPKSFVVLSEKTKKDNRVYITQISTVTLHKRSDFSITQY